MKPTDPIHTPDAPLPAPNQSYLVKTLGCKANLYDSQQLEAQLQLRGWKSQGSKREGHLESPNLCIVNSCSVTDEADKQSRKLAAKLAKENPNATIVMTGCGAEIDPMLMAKSPGIHYVVGNRDKPGLINEVLSAQALDPRPAQGKVLGVAAPYEELLSRHPMDREWPVVESAFLTPVMNLHAEEGRTRAFLKIQEGCNSFCTYCIIPYGRGPNRSLSIDHVVKQVQELVEQGTQEIVITGTNIGDYGLDFESKPKSPQVTQLFKEIFQKTKLPRLRVSSLDPVEIDLELIELMEKEPRFCPHFHVSLQSPHSKILKLMKRKYSAVEVEHCLNRIAEISKSRGTPFVGPFVGMDVITGFPGETKEDFEWGVNALSQLPWTRLHVFPYSERVGTPATRLPKSVPQSERVSRAKILRDLSFERLLSAHQNILHHCKSREAPLTEILLESKTRGPDGSPEWHAGYTPNYLRVLVKASPKLKRNGLVSLMPYQITVDRPSGDVAFLAAPV